MTTAPTVSVIVPNYNYGRYLPRCLDSILAQSYQPLEVLVVDGGSRDDSGAIIQDYARRHPSIRWISETDEGPADAINKGIQLTTGTFLTWLNADDALDPRAIEWGMAAFERHPRLALVYGSALNVEENGAIIGLNRGLKLPADDLAAFDFVPQTGALFRRYDALELRKDLQWGFDWDLWIRLAKRGEILNIDHILGSCIVTGHAERKSDMLIPKRTLELARIARSHSPGLNFRIGLAYATAILGYAFSPLRPIDPHYYRRIVRWANRLSRLVLGQTRKGVML